MTRLLRSLDALGKASSAPRNFRDMCRALDSDYDALLNKYEAVKNDLQALYENPLSTVSVPTPSVSDYARNERKIVEFCLARLLELQHSGIRHTPAVQIILDEVEQVIWDNNVFHSTVPYPHQAAEVYSYTLAEWRDWAFDVANQTWKYFCVFWSCTGLFATLAVCYLRSQYHKRFVLRWMCNVLGFLLLTWALLYIIFLVFGLMIGDAFGRLRSFYSPLGSTPKTTVHFASTPIHEGVYRAAQNTIYMTDLAGNFSIIPNLMQHSRNNILSAADIIAGSKLEYKNVLAAEYSKLVVNMEDLTEVTRKWHIQVDALATQFEKLLSSAIMQMSAINRPVDFSDSIHVTLSLACGVQWLNNPRLHNIHRGNCMMCGALVATTVVSSTCLHTSFSHVPAAYCSSWLKHVPGLQPYLGEIADERVKSVRKLRRFLESLDVDMRELLTGTDRGKALCEMTEQNFHLIREINNRNDNSIKEQLHLVELRKWQLKAWLSWFGIFPEQGETRAELHVMHYNLNQTISLHSVAFELFSRARDVLYTWKADMEGVLSSLQRFEQLAGEGWRGAWEQWPDWDELKRDVEGLQPLVAALGRANAQLESKTKDSEERFRRAREECFDEARKPREENSTFNWEACYDIKKLLLM
ncbi:hypothetical protein ONS96_005271 [Cadophora gregata f. sp. sojae]|nr:hypothetical protein ONS96_005271 [Cadophora gregata f. sp. sojae]